MGVSKLQDSNKVRIDHSLNQSEVKFTQGRRDFVFQSLKKLGIQCSQNGVPNIAVLGSGGGQRAMVGLLGSLVELDKAGLLDCVLYLSGVSGSTWCMASLYQEPDWSTKLQTVKDKIIQRLSGPAVSWGDALAKLKKYYNEKDNFSLTDFWALTTVTMCVKEIDEHTLTDQGKQLNNGPYPIYTVIDKGCKQEQKGDPWVEITPHEAGYSLSGAFVKTYDFGSQFHSGSKKNSQPQMDMLYLQGLCGSALAEGNEIRKFLWEKIEEFLHLHQSQKDAYEGTKEDKCLQVLLKLVEKNLAFLNGNDPSHVGKSIKTLLSKIYVGTTLLFPDDTLPLKQYMKQFNQKVCNTLSLQLKWWPDDLMMWIKICECMAQWSWGTTYDFLHNMPDNAVPPPPLESETRAYEDAGLLNNSPYLTVLRKERNIDLIISFDFSDGEHFKTVTETAKMCKKLNIPFPEVHIPDEDVKKPKDFYVFKGQNAPTVIHIPLFNVVNCGDQLDEWSKKYVTFQNSYSAEMIRDLMEVAGKNISNNTEKLREEIQALTERKGHK